MIVLLTLCVLLSVAGLVYVSSRSINFWLISPAIMMGVYFSLVTLPGIFLASSDMAIENGLFAHLIWFIGAILALVILAIQSTNLSHRNRKVTEAEGNKRVFWFFILLSIPAVVFTFYMLGRVPLLIGFGSLLGGESDVSMHAARRMNTLEHRSGDTIYFGQGYFRQIYAVVSPVFLVALLISERMGRKSIKSKPALLMMFFLTFSAALNGQIWIAIHVMLLFLMAKYFTLIAEGQGKNNLSIIYRGALAYLCLILFAFAFRYLQSLQGREFDNFFFETMERIYSPGAIDLFAIFPLNEGFRFGATWVNDLSGMLPGSNQSFAYEVHHLVHGGGWGYTLSPGIVASSYVNFGYFGVFIIGFIFTYIFSVIFKSLSQTKSAIKIALSIYISHRFTLAMPGDIANYVVCLITAVIIYLSYLFLNSFLSYRKCL